MTRYPISYPNIHLRPFFFKIDFIVSFIHRLWRQSAFSKKRTNMAASLATGLALLQPTKLSIPRASGVSSSSSHVCKVLGSKPASSRVSCSLQQDVKEFSDKFVDASKVAAFALATSALVVSGASAEGTPKRLTYDEIQSQTYMEVKGSGTANQCPTIDGGVDNFPLKPGKYQMKKLCLEPTSFTVKAESLNKNNPPDFQRTKLMTRLTYTLDEIEGPLEVSPDGKVKFEEKDGIDYAAVTVQLPGGERVPFLFTVKQLVASGTPDNFSGEFLVPSYRGSSFLDPKGRGGSTGYDSAVALPAGGRGDEEELVKENIKDTSVSKGKITLGVSKTKPETGELIGVFESVQPSDTDLGAKTPKEVKIQGRASVEESGRSDGSAVRVWTAAAELGHISGSVLLHSQLFRSCHAWLQCAVRAHQRQCAASLATFSKLSRMASVCRLWSLRIIKKFLKRDFGFRKERGSLLSCGFLILIP